MRFTSLFNRRWVLMLFGVGVGVVLAFVATPLWRSAVMAVAQDTYQELTYRCDSAMRSHLIAQMELSNRPSEEAISNLDAAEIALIDCQDYDLMRKNLKLWGLTDNELSLMSLRAIEAASTTMQQVVEIHEIRY